MADERAGGSIVHTIWNKFLGFGEEEEGRTYRERPNQQDWYSSRVSGPQPSEMESWRKNWNKLKDNVDQQKRCFYRKHEEVDEQKRKKAPWQQHVDHLTEKKEMLISKRERLLSAIEELKGISRVAVLTEDQEIKVKEYFVSQHEFKKLEYKKKVLKIAHDICLVRALERIQQELLVLLQHSSQSNTSIDGGGAATGDSTIQVDAKDVEERGRAYGLLLSATMMKGCKMPDNISKKSIPKDVPFGVSQSDHQTVIQTFASKALDLSWKMVTLLPPAIVCTPKIPFDDDWHDPNRVMYDPDNTTTPLIYYQPVLLFGAAIQVGVKGKIANRRSKDEAKKGTSGSTMCVDDDDDQFSSLPSEQKGTSVSTPVKTTVYTVQVPGRDPKKPTHLDAVLRSDPLLQSKKVCAVCSEEIMENEESVVINEKAYHLNHSICHDCEVKLNHNNQITLVFDEGMACCRENEEENEEFVIINEKAYHLNHSICHDCEVKLDHNNQITLVFDEGMVCCKECLEKKKNPVVPEFQKRKEDRKALNDRRNIVGYCVICQKPVMIGGESNVRLDDGKYIHDKCKQVKKCFLCDEYLTATDMKNTRLVPHGMLLCNDCKMCKGCFEFFTKEDLYDRHNLKRQGRYCWHPQCFKCVKCQDQLYGNSYYMILDAVYCPRCR